MPNVAAGEVVKKTKKGRKNITDVKIIRNVNLCHGRNHPQSNVKKCGSYMIEKGKKLVCSSKECGFVCSMPEDAKRERDLGSQCQNKEKKYR